MGIYFRLQTVALIIFLLPGVAVASTWRKVENPKQTLFVSVNNKWGFEAPAGITVRIDDMNHGRSEWVRWGTMASDRPTAQVNYQEGKRFNYLGSAFDRFDGWLKKQHDAQRGNEIDVVQTKYGAAETIGFSKFYKGYDRKCRFFTFLVPDNTVLFRGYLCDEEDGATGVGSIADFINSLEIQ